MRGCIEIGLNMSHFQSSCVTDMDGSCFDGSCDERCDRPRIKAGYRVLWIGISASFLASLISADAFVISPGVASGAFQPRLSSSSRTDCSALYNRKARRKQKKKKVRSNPSFVIEDDEDDDNKNVASGKEEILLGGGEIGFSGEVGESKIPVAKKSRRQAEGQSSGGDDDKVTKESVLSGASISDMPSSPDDQPDVTRIIEDPETGIARIQQGKYVTDKVTGKAVVLSSLGPEYRLAQMFPGVPDDVRDRLRFDWSSITVPEMVSRLEAACTVPLKRGDQEWEGIPPHPQISNPAVDFVLANRDYLGHRMEKTLGRLKLRAQSQFNKEDALRYRALWKHFLLLEDHISAPFRQMVLLGEATVGPNFGNLDVMSYCDGHLYQRTANYLVLKSMVAHWEKKYNDALSLENMPPPVDGGSDFMARLCIGDPKRYLPDPPIIFRLDEVTRITAMAQKMTKAFVDTPQLFNDLPPEIRFLEEALTIQGGTALRQFMLEKFCPENNIDPSSLREGLRRLYQQMFSMQIDPYADLTMTIWNLCEAATVGTEEGQRDPYAEYIANTNVSYETNPGFFQTYTFDHDKNSLVRFLDSAKRIERGTAGPAEDIQKQIQGEALQLLGIKFEQPKPKDDIMDSSSSTTSERYVVPEDRAIGRPHMMGWLDILGEDEELTGASLSPKDDPNVDATAETFEADNWVAVEK